MMLNHVQIWCGASALCDILIAICMTCYASCFSILVVFIDADPTFIAYAQQYQFPSHSNAGNKANSSHYCNGISDRYLIRLIRHCQNINTSYL